VFSGKRVGTRVPPDLVGPVIVVVVLFFALLFAYPWEILTAGTLAYLAALPFGWLSYRGYERRSAETRPAEPQPPAVQSPPLATGVIHPADDENRPPRLN